MLGDSKLGKEARAVPVQTMAAHTSTTKQPAHPPHLLLLLRFSQPPLPRRLTRRRPAVPRAAGRLGAAAAPQLMLVLQPQGHIAGVLVL